MLIRLAVLLAVLIPLPGSAALESYRLISAEEAQAFMQRPSVEPAPPHAVQLRRTRLLLVQGETRAGRCIFPAHYDGLAFPSGPGRVYNSIDLAIDAARCEKLVEEGYTLHPQNRTSPF